MGIESQELSMLSTNETRLKNGSKRQRAKAPKVRTGCITCKTRRVKCDEVKPSCTQCTKGNRECGYQSFTPLPVTTRVLLPKTVAPGPQVEFSVEQPALEYFFLKTAPQLAGFFSHAFFQRSVLQRSFTEPAVRQAIGALGFLHERAAATRRLSKSDEQPHAKYNGIHIQLYNRSIRSIIQYSQKPDSLPLVIMVSLLFACFELLNRNPNAATAHVKSGIGLLNSWREKTKLQMTPTPESRFLEVDIAPLLHIFDLNLMGGDKENRTNFMLNPIVKGRLRLPTQLEDLDDAKVRLIDIIASAMGHPESTICILDKRQKDDTNTQTFLLPSSGVEAMGIWSQAFDDLTLRRGHSWGKRERRSANAVFLTRIALDLSFLVYQVQSECDWDKYRDRYEEVIQICEDTLLDCEDLMGFFAQIINIDSGLLFALHFGAWKCRWPKIRQHCLGLFLRVPQREWDYEAKHFYRIFKRIQEKEEEFIPQSLSLESDGEENCLPPEHVRIHDFAVSQPESLAGSTIYEVSFWTKPDGLQGEWHISTEKMNLDSPRAAHTVMPSNLLPRKVQ